MILALLLALQDDVATVTLAFQKMHCDECKAELEATLRKMQGYKSHQVADAAVAVAFDEKAPLPAFNRLPKDLNLVSVTAALRGTASIAGDKAALVLKGSGAALALHNPDGQDVLSALKSKLGGKNRFQVSGLLTPKGLVLAAFQPADWKD
jgi:copper chaperone CopZ